MNTVHFGYSEDTQVKTNHGWKAIKDVDLQEDKILSVNPDTFEMEYTVAENRLNRVAKEPFIKLAKNAIDVLFVDEQKLLVRKTDKSRPWELLEAREVKQSHYFPLRGFQYIDPEQHTMSSSSICPRQKRVMEGIQELILKVNGSVSQIRDQYIKVKGKFVKFWCIRACTNDNIAHFLGRYQTGKLVSYTGRTYSLQLQKNHVLLVRHNDIICWCGE